MSLNLALPIGYPPIAIFASHEDTPPLSAIAARNGVIPATCVVATATGQPVGMDDAAEARLFPLTDLPTGLVFDHDRIVADYRHFLRTGRQPRPVDGQS